MVAIPDFKVKLPVIPPLKPPMESVGLFKTAEKSTSFPAHRGPFKLTVLLPLVIELASNITLSCGKGTEAAEAPPEDKDQAASCVQFPPSTSIQ